MNVLIADDHGLIAQGVKTFLLAHAPQLLVFEAASKAELQRELQDQKIDVLFQDVRFGPDDARDILPWVRTLSPDTKIIALSSLQDTLSIQQMLSAGCSGYITKGAPLSELLQGIEAVVEGDMYLSSDIRGKVLKAFAQEKHVHDEIQLTGRERQVLRGIHDELSTKEIADQLNISEKTVEGYRANLFLKFQVKNVAGLVKKSMLAGYFTPDSE